MNAWQDDRVFSEETCARTFGLGKPQRDFIFAGRGQTNPLGVLRLDTDRGTFAIKQFTVPPRPAALAVEWAALRAGIPMPRPIPTTSGQPAATYPVTSGSVWVRAYSWIEGEPGDWGRVSESASFDVGMLMARVHALPVMTEDLVEDAWESPGEDGWRVLAAEASARRLAWAELLVEKISLLVEAERRIRLARSRERMSPSQRDYHPPNVVTPPVGPRVLVDWDAAGAAVAREEALQFAVVWATPEGERPRRELVQAFLRGYRDGGRLLEAPSTGELAQQAQANVWWIWFNVRRDLGANPGPDPELVPALLSGIRPVDREALELCAALFR